jgi:NAD(P)-dependent dehydrogenase (short-subunit alcohol dehydrogenase family)
MKYIDQSTFWFGITTELTTTTTMATKTLILITGANQGLGYYTAQQLAAEGKYHVLLGSRDFSKVRHRKTEPNAISETHG